MILFKSDYQQRANYHIDTETKNTSFIKLASLYKKMGISNWAFPLVLYQPELVGINPHNPDIDYETAAKVAVEAKYNPWYAFREVIKIPVQGTVEPVSYTANRANVSMLWCFFNHIDYLLIQPRQTYKSGSVDSLMVYLLFIAGHKININLITKDSILRQENIERLKSIRDYLPYYFYRDNTSDVDNKVALTNHNLLNRYKTAVAQKSAAGANNVGRGMTAPIFHFDEVPFISHIAITLPAALAAGTEAREQAKQTNGYYGNIFTTTAGEKTDRDGAFVYKMMDNACVWSERFYDSKNRSDLIDKVIKNRKAVEGFEQSLLINGTFSHRQLGRSDQWLNEAMANSRGDQEQLKRDFLNIWTSGSRYSPLSASVNEVIFQSEMEPMHIEVTEDNYFLRWYVAKGDKNRFLNENYCVLGLDTSEAIGRDAIGVVLSDIRDMRTIMSANISETNLLCFAHWLADLMCQYKTITLVPEMRSSARVIVDALIIELIGAGIDPLQRIYNKIVDTPERYESLLADLSKRVEYRDRSVNDACRKAYGFITTQSSRQLLFGNNLQLAATRAGHLVLDKVLSKEIRGLVVKNERIDHTASGHDDVCVAWLLNHWFLTHTRHLDKYRIPSILALSMINCSIDDNPITTIEAIDTQQSIRLRIDDIVNQLSQTQSALLSAKLECELKNLTHKIDTKDKGIYNFDALIKKVKNEKIKKRKEKQFSFLNEY